jgi:hypothetical protein
MLAASNFKSSFLKTMSSDPEKKGINHQNFGSHSSNKCWQEVQTEQIPCIRSNSIKRPAHLYVKPIKLRRPLVAWDEYPRQWIARYVDRGA